MVDERRDTIITPGWTVCEQISLYTCVYTCIYLITCVLMWHNLQSYHYRVHVCAAGLSVSFCPKWMNGGVRQMVSNSQPPCSLPCKKAQEVSHSYTQSEAQMDYLQRISWLSVAISNATRFALRCYAGWRKKMNNLKLQPGSIQIGHHRTVSIH